MSFDDMEQTTIPAESVEIMVEEPAVEETTEIAVMNDEPKVLADFEILNPAIPMENKIGVATNVANCLADVIRSQGLVKKGLNKKDKDAEYVLIDGWEVLGTMLGIVPVSRVVETIYNKQERIIGYKARAFLYRNPKVDADGNIIDGDLIATAEASATKDGFQKETFSMMSMAQTRALSKSYRMALGWIIQMAGFESTPAEEMPKFNGR